MKFRFRWVALLWLGGFALLLVPTFRQRVSVAEEVSPTRTSLVEVGEETKPELDSESESELDLSVLEVGDLVSADADDSLVVAELISRLPFHKGTGHQFMVSSHIANIATDEDYELVERVILDHASLESAALDVLLADLHSRVESIKLPTFAKICLDGDHPAYNEAFASLRTYCEDSGEDLEAWQSAAYEYGQ